MEKKRNGSRMKVFATAILTAVICFGITISAYADTLVTSIDVTTTGAYNDGACWADVDGDTVRVNGLLKGTEQYYVNETTKVTLNGKATEFLRKSTEEGVVSCYFKVKASPDPSPSDDGNKDSGGSKKKSEHHEPGSWVKNPNEKQSLGMTAAGLAAGTTLGWQEQGELGKLAFATAKPAGWSEGFSFNILTNGNADYSLTNGNADYSLKSGTLQLYIPAEYIKTGRQFAILGIGKNGIVKIFTDQDTNPNTVTINLNLEGYALELINKD